MADYSTQLIRAATVGGVGFAYNAVMKSGDAITAKRALDAGSLAVSNFVAQNIEFMSTDALIDDIIITAPLYAGANELLSFNNCSFLKNMLYGAGFALVGEVLADTVLNVSYYEKKEGEKGTVMDNIKTSLGMTKKRVC